MVGEEKDGNSLSLQIATLHILQVAGGVFITNNTELELFMKTKFPATFLNPINGNLNPNASLQFNY